MDILTAMETLGMFFGEDDGICAGAKEKEAWNQIWNYVTATLMARLAMKSPDGYDRA